MEIFNGNIQWKYSIEIFNGNIQWKYSIEIFFECDEEKYLYVKKKGIMYEKEGILCEIRIM